MTIALIAAGLVLAGYLAWAARTWADAVATARMGQAQARRVGFDLDPVVADSVVPRLANRLLVGAVGGVTGGATITLWLAGAGLTGGPAWFFVWCGVGVLLGRSVVLAGLALIEAWRAAPEPGPRVARASRPLLADYVAAPERGLAVVMSVLPALLLAGRWATSGSTATPHATAANTVAVPLLVLLAGGLLARQITTRPQPAASPRALAWNDALRARTLRDVVAAVALVGVSYSLLLTGVLSIVPFTTPPVSPVVTTSIAVVLLTCGILASRSALTPSPGAQFKRRLWAHDPAPGGAPHADADA